MAETGTGGREEEEAMGVHQRAPCLAHAPAPGDGAGAAEAAEDLDEDVVGEDRAALSLHGNPPRARAVFRKFVAQHVSITQGACV
jgi:hypothetical protein